MVLSSEIRINFKFRFCELAEINRKLSDILQLSDTVEHLMNANETADSVEHSIDIMSKKYDEVLSQLTRQRHT